MPERNDVSFQSREKKRKYRAAVAKSKRRHSSETARRWFLTIAGKAGAGAVCGDRLAADAELVYSPRWVREHKVLFGGVPMPDGPRPRLCFDPARVDRVLAERRLRGDGL